MVVTTARELRRVQADLPVMAFEAVPHGWFVFELDEDDDRSAMRHIVPFYAHQAPCWEACLHHLWALDLYSGTRSAGWARGTAPRSRNCDRAGDRSSKERPPSSMWDQVECGVPEGELAPTRRAAVPR